MSQPDLRAATTPREALVAAVEQLRRIADALTTPTASQRREAPPTCDASPDPDTGLGTQLIGPCTLHHGHDGPVHRDATGCRWAARPERLLPGDRRTCCDARIGHTPNCPANQPADDDGQPTSGVTIDGAPAVVISLAELNTLTARMHEAEAVAARVEALAAECPVAIDTAHLHAALDGTAPHQPVYDAVRDGHHDLDGKQP